LKRASRCATRGLYLAFGEDCLQDNQMHKFLAGVDTIHTVYSPEDNHELLPQ